MEIIAILFMPILIIVGGLAIGFAPIVAGAITHQFTEDKLPKSGCWILTIAAFFMSVYLIDLLFVH